MSESELGASILRVGSEGGGEDDEKRESEFLHRNHFHLQSKVDERKFADAGDPGISIARRDVRCGCVRESLRLNGCSTRRTSAASERPRNR